MPASFRREPASMTPGGSCDSLTCRRSTGVAASLYAEALIPNRTPAATAPMKIIN